MPMQIVSDVLPAVVNAGQCGMSHPNSLSLVAGHGQFFPRCEYMLYTTEAWS